MVSVEFETPENIVLRYEPAGLGSRYLAWLIDWVIIILPFLAVMAAVLFNYRFFGSLVKDENAKFTPTEILCYVGVLTLLMWSVVTIAYFGFFELIMRGQTPGKKIMKIRVVRLQGFSLDAASIAVRTFFRVIDNLPPLWIVALLNRQSQRLGDIVAKTIVIADKVEDPSLTHLKEELLSKNRSTFTNRFDALKIKKIPHEAIAAAEKALLRWDKLYEESQNEINDDLCAKLAGYFNLPTPTIDNAQEFLEEFLSTEYQIQYRQLG